MFTVRHYCQGIGDCHLLSFPKAGGKPFRMLIDCGVHSSVTGGSDLIGDIVDDLHDVTGGVIDVLVVTHEHWDHVSGFMTAAEKFKDFTIGEVWMSWTENPKDPAAAELDKFRQQALSALQGASQRLDRSASGLHMAGIRDGLHALLGFQFGAAGEKVRTARNNAASLAKGKQPLYREPGDEPFTIPGVPHIRVYVLGPPRAAASIKLEEKASEMYRLALSAGRPAIQALKSGLAALDATDGTWPDEACPFDGNIGVRLSGVLDGSASGSTADFVRTHYSGARNKITKSDPAAELEWRRIDGDWLGVAAQLAMQLDRGVNNTSLVLAFEHIDTGRVYLFPGDAQIGSWLSWQDLSWKLGKDKEVTASDLLARTVYLKVAHHGSQNATPEGKGLELMTSDDLSAFVPTNKDDAVKVRWGEMPFHAIMSRLLQKTGKRVIRADDDWLAVAGGKPGFSCPAGSIVSIAAEPRKKERAKGGLWVEVEIA